MMLPLRRTLPLKVMLLGNENKVQTAQSRQTGAIKPLYACVPLLLHVELYIIALRGDVLQVSKL